MSAPALPIPPLEYRAAVGPREAAAWDNPTRGLLFGDLGPGGYDAVLDFGCGCGRLARQLMQQDPPPERYLGVDLHPELIAWCQANLTPRAPAFEFVHHDVFHEAYNPGAGKPRALPLPVPDAWATLVIAHSVFTHVLQDDIEHYLHEFARVLQPDGVARATFFLFDKRAFPMMEPHRNALYTDPEILADAVIVDREWLRRTCDRAGLVIADAVPPEIRGYHWVITLARRGAREPVELPPDTAPYGMVGGARLPVGADDPPAPAADPLDRARDDAAAHAEAAARERARADALAGELEATRTELRHTRARLEYVHGLPPVRLARAVKRRLGR